MDSDYDDSSPGNSSSESSSKPAEKKNESIRTALADKALFPEDVKPGYRCEIEVLAVHESEVEFKKLPHKKEGELKSSTTKSAPTSESDEYA